MTPTSSHADTRPLAVALMGPTASGKTALAMEWVARFGMQIISVDSALVYRRLDIGSAKPDAAMQQRAPHRLIDIRDPHESYSAAEFRQDALREMSAIHSAGQVPLLVGGTGLYFRALFQGLSDMPEADRAMRERIRQEASEQGWPAMHAQLAAMDPKAAERIKPGDTQRIQRALEVFRLTGRPISDWQQSMPVTRFPYRVLKLVAAPAERAVLHERIARRFDQMLEQGFLDEVRRLQSDARLHADLSAIRAVGYRQAWQHLLQGTSTSQFREQAIAATRQLAKRQITWLRGVQEARWLDPASQAHEAEQAVRQFLSV